MNKNRIVHTIIYTGVKFYVECKIVKTQTTRKDKGKTQKSYTKVCILLFRNIYLGFNDV